MISLASYSGYWAEASPRARRLITELLNSGVTERFGTPDVWVARLKPPSA